MPLRPVPTILDTDIGGDIDDTWALAFMLCCPEIDLKMVATDTGHTEYRARITAKLLQLAGRADVPVAVGIRQNDEEQGQAEWVRGYELSDYPGPVLADGVTGLVEAIMGSPEPLTLACIGPMPNIARALEIEPAIAGKCHFVGMHGSVYRGYGGGSEVVAEYNVSADTAACRAVFEAPWLSRTITPLDTCGLVQLKGEQYQLIRESQVLIPRVIMENYLAWAQANGYHNAETESSILFDTVAAWLVFSREFLRMETLPIAVTDDGFTRIQEGAAQVDCAAEWTDQEAYQRVLVERLLTGGPGAA